MNTLLQAPLYYFHHLINLGGFEAERIIFYDRIDNWTEHQPFDLIVDREKHIISYSLDDNGVPTPIQFHLEINLDLQNRKEEAANAIYIGLNSKSENEQPIYRLRLTKELEAMLSTINTNLNLKDYAPLKNCVLELLRSVKNQSSASIELLSFRYKDKNLKRTNDKLKNLHSSLIFRKLIDPNTPLLDLKAVFQEKSIKRRVKWTGLNWQLNLFILQIKDCVTSQAEMWVTTAFCFVDRRGEAFTNLNLCQLKYPKTKIEKQAVVIEIAEAFRPD